MTVALLREHGEAQKHTHTAHPGSQPGLLCSTIGRSNHNEHESVGVLLEESSRHSIPQPFKDVSLLNTLNKSVYINTPACVAVLLSPEHQSLGTDSLQWYTLVSLMSFMTFLSLSTSMLLFYPSHTWANFIFQVSSIHLILRIELNASSVFRQGYFWRRKCFTKMDKNAFLYYFATYTHGCLLPSSFARNEGLTGAATRFLVLT